MLLLFDEHLRLSNAALRVAFKNAIILYFRYTPLVHLLDLMSSAIIKHNKLYS